MAHHTDHLHAHLVENHTANIILVSVIISLCLSLGSAFLMVQSGNTITFNQPSTILNTSAAVKQPTSPATVEPEYGLGGQIAQQGVAAQSANLNPISQ